MSHRKIERWHQTLNNRILLDNYYLPGADYNHSRYHEPTSASDDSPAIRSNARPSPNAACITNGNPRNGIN
jgi:hypothetical protein